MEGSGEGASRTSNGRVKYRPDHRRTLSAAEAVAAAAQASSSEPPVSAQAPSPPAPEPPKTVPRDVQAAPQDAPTPPGKPGRRKADLVALGLAAVVIVGFTAVLLFGPKAADPPSADVTPTSTSTTSTRETDLFSASVTPTDAYPPCAEVTGATAVVTCTRGGRTLTIAPPGSAGSTRSVAALISDTRVRRSTAQSRRQLSVRLLIGNLESESRRPARKQLYVSLAGKRYTARSVSPTDALGPRATNTLRVTFSVPDAVARRAMRPGDTVAIAVANFGTDAQITRRLALLKARVGDG